MPSYDGVRMRRDSEGRWHYRGPACTYRAIVYPDGRVGFKDLPPVGSPKVAGSPPLSAPGDSQARHFSGIVIGVSFVFDVTDMVMRGLGQDPYGAEKRRFASKTRSWRTKLRARWHKDVREKALTRFRIVGPLCRHYTRLDAAGRARYRAWLFARWDETREDALGTKLRLAIVDAIRRCKIGYAVAERKRLNQRRRSQAPFAP